MNIIKDSSCFFNNSILIKGRPGFVEEIEQTLIEITQVPVGRAVLHKLASRRIVHVIEGTRCEAVVKDLIPTVAINLEEVKSARILVENVTKGPEFEKITLPVSLFHELVHIYHFQNEKILKYCASVPLSEPWSFAHKEEEITILGKERGDRPSISENTFRRECGLPLRLSHVASYFKKGTDPYDVCGEENMSRLHEAALMAPGELTELLSRVHDVDILDHSNATPLHYAAGSSFKHSGDCISILLSKKADINAQDTKGETPLFKAVATHQLKNAETLLNSGASTSIYNNDGQTAIFKAIKNCNPRMVILFLQHHPSILEQKNEKGQTPMQFVEEIEKELTDQILNLERISEIGALSEEGEKHLGTARIHKAMNSLINQTLKYHIIGYNECSKV